MKYIDAFSELIEYSVNLPPNNAKEYSEYFNSLKSKYESYINEFIQDYNSQETNDAKDKIINALSDALIDSETNKIENTRRFRRGFQLSMDSMFVSSYTIPFFDNYKNEACDKLCDTLVNKWRTTFKKHQINRGSYDIFLKGFGESSLIKKMLNSSKD